ncbi:flavin reductase family protein [Solirubrobacter soli]|uniref:flavin reductase family protein n=1 Tax=Solirubrobacter soli TaxID=363832 RepID=UPI00048980D5|nr:flavin reductase family protein [Solirubrobacter soli]
MSTTVTEVDLRRAMGHFATGVTIVTAAGSDGRRHGSTANAVASVSLEPPLVLVCLREQSLTLAALLDSGRFAVNVLHQRQRELAQRFARRGATWDDVAHRDGLLDGALATLECEVHDVADGGDHQIVVGRVLAVEHRDEPPLLFFRGAYTELQP